MKQNKQFEKRIAKRRRKGKLVTKAILLISKLSYDPRQNIERKYISDIKTLLVFHP